MINRSARSVYKVRNSISRPAKRLYKYVSIQAAYLVYKAETGFSVCQVCTLGCDYDQSACQNEKQTVNLTIGCIHLLLFSIDL